MVTESVCHTFQFYPQRHNIIKSRKYDHSQLYDTLALVSRESTNKYNSWKIADKIFLTLNWKSFVRRRGGSRRGGARRGNNRRGWTVELITSPSLSLAGSNALRAHCSGQQQRLRSTTTFSFSQEGRQRGHDLVMSPSTRYFIAFLCIYIPLYLWHNKLKRTHHTSQHTSRKEFRKFFDFQKDLTAKLLARESLNLL